KNTLLQTVWDRTGFFIRRRWVSFVFNDLFSYLSVNSVLSETRGHSEAENSQNTQLQTVGSAC
ncbi:MAG: hypothetical protein ACE5I1_27870, partial [bacterium]